LIPVRVRLCEPPGLLQPIVYCDLVGLDEVKAKTALIGAVSGARLRTRNPIFPGTDLSTHPVPQPKDADSSYEESPGCNSAVSLDNLSPPISSAVDLLGLLRTTRTTFEAQARLRVKPKAASWLTLTAALRLDYFKGVDAVKGAGTGWARFVFRRQSPLPAANSIYEPIESSNCGLWGGVYNELSSICRARPGFARFTWYFVFVELV
jgi:hypothetical protein